MHAMKIIHKMLLYSFKMLYWWWSVQDVGCRILYMYSVNTLANNVTSLTSLYYMCAMMANITMTIPRNQDSPQFWGYMIALAISLIQIVRPTPHPAWLLFFKKSHTGTKAKTTHLTYYKWFPNILVTWSTSSFAVRLDMGLPDAL